VLVQDDDSNDGTCEIAREFAGCDTRFRIQKNPRRLGLVGNWNACVQQARGEWIKFVFQDDLLLPGCLERMLAVAERTESSFVCCRRDFLFEPGTTPQSRQFYASNASQVDQFFSKGGTVQPSVFAEAILRHICANFVGEPTVTLLHRGLFDRFGMFNENLIMCCDSEYWYRAGTQVGVAFIPETLAVFRVHSGSTSAENFERRQFRMHYLDPLVVLHEFAYNPNYSSLRRVARARFGANYLTRLCREHGWRAWRVLKQKESTKRDDALQSRQELEAVCKVYPRLGHFTREPGWLENTWLKRRLFSPKTAARRLLRALG
jgi:glycosyltransferase involved in cell wall biosynthesis